MPRTSLRKKQAVSYNEDRDDDEMPKPTMAKAVAAASKIVEKANGTVSKAATTKASTKRKAEPEAESAASAPAPAPAPAAKVTKKRKTKAKDEDATPLANRTAVSELKPAMHIGAHVSAAGGAYIASPAVFVSY